MHFGYPMEAIELRAFVPDADNLLSFGVAIAILVFDDLNPNGSGRDHMCDRKNNKTLDAIGRLPSEYSKPIFAGLTQLETTQ